MIPRFNIERVFARIAAREKRVRFDLTAFLATHPKRVVASAIDIEAVLRGTRNVAPARISGYALPVRAVSQLEVGQCEEHARAVLGLEELGRGARGLEKDLAARHLLARCVLDPFAFADDRRVPLWTPSEITSLHRDAIDELLVALDRVQRAAHPRFDSDREAERFVRQLRGRAAAHHEDRFQARHLAPAAFFRVTPDEITTWQAVFFALLTAN